MKTPEQDRKSQDLLDQLDGLQSAHELHRDEPPLMIDQAVRNMARRAIQAPATRKTRGLGWIAGLSTASVALIALGISLVQAPKSNLPPLKPSLESMSPTQSDLAPDREEEAGRPGLRSQSGKAKSGAPLRKADRPAAAATQAMDMQAERMALEESSMDSSEMDLADETHKQEKEAFNASPLSQPTSQPTSQATSQADSQSEAEAWLDLIRQLQEQGLDSEVLTQLQAFRTRYPDYLLPDWAQKIDPEGKRETARQ